ncbi:hypothetical protein Tco_0801135 [Tanacetum coccineum]|uniref:Gag-Pol polyprotein n=1 Tax=Tanacetum coccineum TaxID=301880 RepID=A0ABQ4ZZ77_9ASTR
MHNNIMEAGLKDRPPMLGQEDILSGGPYKLTSVVIEAVAATVNSREVPEHGQNEIYSTVDACNTANDMWTAIERLQQGESLNIQDVKTNLFWEFGKFTSRDGESMESYYSRFYKLMNELTRNNLQVTTMQVNVQFLQQLQPEWSRFVTVVKQSKEIDTIHIIHFLNSNSYHIHLPEHKWNRDRQTQLHLQSESYSEEDSDPEQPQRDKDM